MEQLLKLMQSEQRLASNLHNFRLVIHMKRRRVSMLLGHRHGCPYLTRIQVSDLISFLLDTTNNI
jgi:hypothetical protein